MYVCVCMNVCMYMYICMYVCTYIILLLTPYNIVGHMELYYGRYSHMVTYHIMR